MDSIIPITVTRDGSWRGAANSTVQPSEFLGKKSQAAKMQPAPSNKFKEMTNSVQMVNQGFPIFNKDTRRKSKQQSSIDYSSLKNHTKRQSLNDTFTDKFPRA